MLPVTPVGCSMYPRLYFPQCGVLSNTFYNSVLMNSGSCNLGDPGNNKDSMSIAVVFTMWCVLGNAPGGTHPSPGLYPGKRGAEKHHEILIIKYFF